MSANSAGSSYVWRHVDDELEELLPGAAAIALDGPKAVGKTATALRRAQTVFRLDREDSARIVDADPDRLTQGPWPVLIDEWQRYPQSWDLVRRAVDDGAQAGSYLLTGSASPATPPTHSGAGRIVRLRMRPMSLVERQLAVPTVSLGDLLTGGRSEIVGQADLGLETYIGEIVKSGLPGIRDHARRLRRAYLGGYVDGVVDRDFADQGQTVRRPAALRRWMTAYAAATSTTASFETIRAAATGSDGITPARSTVQPYRDTLEKLWIVDPIPAWLPSRNHVARAAAAPKHQLADPALAAQLLGADESALLDGQRVGPVTGRDTLLVGQLFEALVALSVRAYAQSSEARVRHFRTRSGDREVDLIIERPDHRVVAIEVKLAASVSDRDVRHLVWLRGRLGPDLLDAVVVTTGADAYRRRDGIAVVPAVLLGP